MVFAQMRTLSIGAACEFTRGSEHFAPLPSQSRVTRRGWLASLSLSPFFSFRPPSSRHSPAASDCLGPAGETLTAKTDHVSWGETKWRGFWQPQNYLDAICLNYELWEIHPCPAWISTDVPKPMQWKLWNSGTGGRRKIWRVTRSMNISCPIALCCVLYQLQQIWKRFLRIQVHDIWVATSSTEFHVPSHCVFFCMARRNLRICLE